MGNTGFLQDVPIMPGISGYLPTIIKQCTLQTSMSSATTKDVYIDNNSNTILNIPQNFFAPGTSFRVTMGGTKTSTNAAMTIAVILNGTTITTITADDSTAVKWAASIILSSRTLATQSCCAHFLADTADPDVQCDTGTVDMSKGGTLKFQLGGNSSDTVTCEYFLLEYWQIP